MESLFFWAAAIGYAIAAILLTAGVVFKRERYSDAGFWLSAIAFAAQSASIIARWVASGRLPYVQDYETALAGTWFIMAGYLLLVWRKTGVRVAGVAVVPFVILALGYGITQPTAAGPVVPAFKSLWLVIHVLFAWFTYAAYTSCAALAIVELLKREKRPVHPSSPLNRTLGPDALSELTFRLVGFGLIVNTAMIASGAIWAFELWGSYWRWDPVETWSLLTWLAYAFYLHARLTLGWKGRRLAWIAVFALLGVMMSFWGVQFAPTSYHLFRSITTSGPTGGRF